jgi:hypothetical protein
MQLRGDKNNFLANGRSNSLRTALLGYNQTKSLYISPIGSYSYGTEYEIWAGFGPVGSSENFGLGRKVTFEDNFLCFPWQKRFICIS